MKKKSPALGFVNVPVAEAAPEYGLTMAQVAERTASGCANLPVEPPTRTVGQIILSNVFTYFNMLFLLLAVCIILVRSWLDLTFMGVVFFTPCRPERTGVCRSIYPRDSPPVCRRPAPR